MPNVRPVLSETDLGSLGWRTLHELARQRRRSPSDQALQLIRYALYRAISGNDVELSQTRLRQLLSADNEVAA